MISDVRGRHLLDEVCVGRGVEAGPRPLAAPAPRTRGDPHPAPGHHHVSGQRRQAGDSRSISIIITIRAEKESSQFLVLGEGLYKGRLSAKIIMDRQFG